MDDAGDRIDADTMAARILEAAPDGMVLVDPDGRIVRVNEEAESLFGYDREELLGEQVEVLVPEGLRGDHEAHREGYMEEPERRPMGVDLDLWAARADGTEFPVEISLSPIPVDEGGPPHVLAAVRDVTDHHRLTRAQHQLADVVDASDDAIVSLDLDGTVRTWNPGARGILGVGADEMEGSPFRDVLEDAGARDRFDELLQQAVEDEASVEAEMWFPVQDGDRVHGHLKLSPVRGPRGQPQGLSLILRDRTEARREREQLEDTLALQRSILESTGDGILVVDLDGQVVTYNDQFVEMWDLPQELVDAGDDEKLLEVGLEKVEDPDAWIERVEEIYQEPAEVAYDEFQMADGRVIERNGYPHHREGEIVGRVWTFQDVTEEREAERELERYTAQLEESNENLQRFVYAVSHDLREPLRMVKNYVQLLERRFGDELGDEAGEFIEFAVDGVDRMENLIQGLLRFSRVQTHGQPFQEVDLEEVLADVEEGLKILLDEADAEVTHDPLPTVVGDPSQLGQVLQNLLDNAVKHRGDDPPRVHVSAREEDDRWILEVEDDGAGIAPKHHDRIFDIFQRLGRETKGTGMGLAICQRIVERHGGDISVDSAEGEGSTFAVSLPKDPRDGADEPSA